MLHRSASTQRGRVSRNQANSSHPSGKTGVKSRRASVATERPMMSMTSNMERQRSPRSSIVPDIAFDTESDSTDENYYKISPEADYYGPPMDIGRVSRSTLKPTDYYRSPRNSLTPRKSLTPEVPHSPRNSLVTDTPYLRNNFPLTGSRTSLIPENGGIPIPSRSPRHSLVPDVGRSPRSSVTNLEMVDRSPRGSICLEPCRSMSPRGSITPMDMERSPRGSIASECLNHSPRGSIPDLNRSPRASICPEINHSPRGSVAVGCRNRSPRSSIGVNELDRHSRTSVNADNEDDIRSPRGSIGMEVIDKSPRCSLGGTHDRRLTRGSLPIQDYRRASLDHGTPIRNWSSYRHRNGNSGSVRSGGGGVGAMGSAAYGNHVTEESRRPSSSVSQFSGDESRRLCANGSTVPEKSYREKVNLAVATYGSVGLGLKDAHLEANNTCDFVFRALRVVCRTTVVTVLLAILFIMPVLMLIFGLNYVNDCLAEPTIPVYMIIGGTCGILHMGVILYSQIRSRKPDVLSVPPARKRISPIMMIAVPLSCFLIIWFILGNYWILHIKWPEFKRSLYTPEKWCDRTLYLFSFAHLCIMYGVLGITLFLAISLAFYRIFTCPFPERRNKKLSPRAFSSNDSGMCSCTPMGLSNAGARNMKFGNPSIA